MITFTPDTLAIQQKLETTKGLNMQILAALEFYAGLLALIIAGTGSYLLITLPRQSQSPLNLSILEILGLCYILPAVILIGMFKDISPEVVFTFFGTLIGYIFGKSQKDEKSEQK